MIYLCVPARNEERTLGVLLWKLRKVMAEFGRDYEIVVLDDASTDGTPEVLARYEPFLPLRTHRAEIQLGYGAALEWLLRDVAERAPYPKRDVIVTLQADFTEDPASVVPMVKAIEGGADLVAGVPETPLPSGSRSARFARWAAPRLLGRAHRSAPVADPLSGFRAYRIVVVLKALRELDEGEDLLRGPGWAANLGLLARAAPHARRIEEVPFRVRSFPRPRGSRFRSLSTLRALLPLRRTSWPAAPGR